MMAMSMNLLLTMESQGCKSALPNPVLERNITGQPASFSLQVGLRPNETELRSMLCEGCAPMASNFPQR